MNRLARETSPYLLQHRHNPVDWYSWGEEAFAAAREQNKPIFLSVGYSTCYWCHVMERQCFENEAIAGVMNELFINIKVDREERPDVDQLYMTAVQVLTRQGGWPMSVFLLPDLRPFYGGTYFPPTDGYGRPGFPTLLAALADAYRNRRGEVEKSAAQLVGILEQIATPGAAAGVVDEGLIESLIERSVADYDSREGGFGGAPKFPRETLLELLLVRNSLKPDARLLGMVTRTLDAMAGGGIRDQLGGGFHRYSTDAHWLVPHFEIMLYDNAMLGWCYAEAFRQTREQRYAGVARGVFDFVLTEMTDAAGGFYTALDAEVDGQEGLNYLWTREEVQQVLAEAIGAGERVDRFCKVYGLDDGPNFADPHHGNGRADRTILHLPDGDLSALGDPDLKQMRGILLAERKTRRQPLLDTKIITSWNGLMIRALARGGLVLQDESYLAAAGRAAEFLVAEHRRADGTLWRTSREGKTKHAGFLDDYAFLAQGLLDLGRFGGNRRWKREAEAVVEAMYLQFGDEQGGGLFFSAKDDPNLIVRQKVGSDSPLPSGNAAAAHVLVGLGQAERAREIVQAFGEQLSQNGEAMSAMVEAGLWVRWDANRQAAGLDAIGLGGGDFARVVPLAKRAREIVRMSALWIDGRRLAVRVTVAEGFHINGNPAAVGLKATVVTVFAAKTMEAVAARVEYPSAALLKLGGFDEAIPVYQGEVELVVAFAEEVAEELSVVLGYQACDDRSCLPLVSKTIEVEPQGR